MLRLNAVSVDPPVPAPAAGPPPADWLTAVNRQSLALRLLATKTTVSSPFFSLSSRSGPPSFRHCSILMPLQSR